MIDLKEKDDSIKQLEEQYIRLEENNETQQVVTIQKKNKKWIIISIIILFIILLLFSTIFALINIGNEKIIKGISIENIDVSNLTKEEAINLLEEISEQTEENCF